MKKICAIASVSIILFFSSCSLFQNKIDTAIDRGLANLQRRNLDLLPMIIPTLDHLVKTYGLKFNLDHLVKDLLSQKNNPRRIFLRSLDPSITATQAELARLTGIDAITAAALYCDKFPLRAGFWQYLHAMADHGGYALTHATLALMMVRAGKCAVDEHLFYGELTYQVEKMGRLMRRIRPETDLGIEAIVMLYGMKDIPQIAEKVPEINPTWIVRIIHAQRPDGSWYDNDHTTVLAIWALLEARRAGTLH